MWRVTVVLVAVLLALSGAAWLILARQSSSMATAQDMGKMARGSLLAPLANVKPGMAEAGPLLFVSVWVLMMVAMMFPSVAPMVLGYAVIVRQKEGRPVRWLKVGVFTGGYLLAWAAVGVGALILNLAATRYLELPRPPWVLQAAGGAVLIAAGLYQFTAWKRTCLSHCRSSLAFFMHNWRPGVTGAVRMGMHHGTYCVGCCWGLMAVLFMIGLMNLAWMALLSVVIAVEKLTPQGMLATRFVGSALVVSGFVMIVWRVLG